MVKKMIVIVMMATVISLLTLSGCSSSNSHGIPNGEYVGDFLEGVLRQEDNNYDYFWLIKKNKASFYASGQLSCKCDIVKEEGIMFFVFAGSGSRSAFKHEVKYNAEEKKITLHP